MQEESFDDQKRRAEEWFYELRTQIVLAFEKLESQATQKEKAIGFEVTPTKRPGGGSGFMSVLRGGRVFEKVGVNFSAVHGELAPSASKAMSARGVPGLDQDPRFWASGVSLVAHMANPHCPAVHMNTRMFWTPGAWWFGGGADLNPAIEYAEDTEHFHAEMQKACDAHSVSYYQKFKEWADEYFFITHRKRARGVGGIFYDDLNTGDWEKDFAFNQSVGRAFLPAFIPLVNKRLHTKWDEKDRDVQLYHRGLYAEYNLLYDRGTKFGLETGHNADAVLMSLPPVAKWY